MTVYSFADTRIPAEEQIHNARNFMEAHDMCLQKGMPRLFREKLFREKLFILDGKVRATLQTLAWKVPVSIADVEFKHKRNRTRASEGLSWSQFSAGYVNEELRLRSTAARRSAAAVAARLGLLGPRQPRRAAEPQDDQGGVGGGALDARGCIDNAAGGDKQYKNKKSPLELYRYGLFEEAKMYGKVDITETQQGSAQSRCFACLESERSSDR